MIDESQNNMPLLIDVADRLNDCPTERLFECQLRNDGFLLATSLAVVA